MEDRWYHQIGAGRLCDSLDEVADHVLKSSLFRQEPISPQNGKDESEILVAVLALILAVFIIVSAKYTGRIREEYTKAYYINTIKKWSDVLDEYMVCWAVLRKTIDGLYLSREMYNESICSSLQNHLEEIEMDKEKHVYEDMLMAPSILQTIFKLEKLTGVHDKVVPRIHKISSYLNDKYVQTDDSDDGSVGEPIRYLEEYQENTEVKNDYAEALNYFLVKSGSDQNLGKIEPKHNEEGDGRSNLSSEELVAIINKYLDSIGEVSLSFQDTMYFVSTIYDNLTMKPEDDCNSNSTTSIASVEFEEICDTNFDI